MAVVSTPTKVIGRMLLENGTTASGAVKTLNVNFGTLAVANWDDEKAWALAMAFDNVASKTLYKVEKVLTSTVEE